MDQSKTRMLAEAGVAIAIAQVLSFITIFHMPQGGSIKAAALVPLMIYAYRWGGARGIFAGVVYGILHFILGFKSSVHYLSIILDYLVAYGAIGVWCYWRLRLLQRFYFWTHYRFYCWYCIALDRHCCERCRCVR